MIFFVKLHNLKEDMCTALEDTIQRTFEKYYEKIVDNL